MTIGELLSQVLQPIFDLLPQVARRPLSNEQGVRDALGSVRRFWWPQLHIPAVTHIEYWPKHIVSIDLGLQTLTTADGKSIAVNATAMVRVGDPIALREFASAETWEETVAMLVRGSLSDIVMGHNLSDVIDRGEELLESEVWEDLYTWGVTIRSVVLEDLTECWPIRVMGNTAGSEEI